MAFPYWDAMLFTSPTLFADHLGEGNVFAEADCHWMGGWRASSLTVNIGLQRRLELVDFVSSSSKGWPHLYFAIVRSPALRPPCDSFPMTSNPPHQRSPLY